MGNSKDCFRYWLKVDYLILMIPYVFGLFVSIYRFYKSNQLRKTKPTVLRIRVCEI